METVYLDGRLVPAGDAKISVFDYGFLFGWGVFETMRAYGGRVFQLEEHLERLHQGVRLLDLKLEGDAGALARAVSTVLEANGLKDARVRLTVSGGPGSAVPDPSSCGPATVLAVVRPYAPYPSAMYASGFKAVISNVRRSAHSQSVVIKSLSALDTQVARRSAREVGADEAILLDERGLVSEGSSTNIFFVSEGGLHTPGEDCGILPGIARQTVLRLAQEMGLEVQQRHVLPQELLQADEAFLTNSLIEVMPLASVDGQVIGSGKAGRVTLKLLEAYRDLVRRSA